MNTFLKIIGCVVVAVVAFKLLPILLIPVVLTGGVVLLLAALLVSGFLATAGVGLTAILGLLAVVLVLAAALSPIWLPVLAVVGLIALIRRSSRRTA